MDLLQLPGLGPKKARALYQELHVQTLPQLLRAARDNRVRTVGGFGARSQQRLIEAIENQLSKIRRCRLADASAWAQGFAQLPRAAPKVHEVMIAGSLRRARDMVGDIDQLAVAENGKAVGAHFAQFPGVRQRIGVGGARASSVLPSGIQAHLRVVSRPSAGAGAALL
ncbi:DNA polymerase X (fragment) [Burkholderiales bacterium]